MTPPFPRRLTSLSAICTPDPIPQIDTIGAVSSQSTLRGLSENKYRQIIAKISDCLLARKNDKLNRFANSPPDRHQWTTGFRTALTPRSEKEVRPPVREIIRPFSSQPYAYDAED